MPAKKNRKPAAHVNRSFPFSFTWIYMNEVFRSHVLPAPCQFCGAVAVVALPAILLAAETDGTTHVCHPSAGGCNHGFAKDSE